LIPNKAFHLAAVYLKMVVRSSGKLRKKTSLRSRKVDSHAVIPAKAGVQSEKDGFLPPVFAGACFAGMTDAVSCVLFATKVSGRKEKDVYFALSGREL